MEMARHKPVNPNPSKLPCNYTKLTRGGKVVLRYMGVAAARSRPGFALSGESSEQ